MHTINILFDKVKTFFYYRKGGGWWTVRLLWSYIKAGVYLEKRTCLKRKQRDPKCRSYWWPFSKRKQLNIVLCSYMQQFRFMTVSLFDLWGRYSSIPYEEILHLFKMHGICMFQVALTISLKNLFHKRHSKTVTKNCKSFSIKLQIHNHINPLLINWSVM